MKLSRERKAQTGAYYTPECVAEHTFQRFVQIYGDQIHRVRFYDPTAGEGALLEPFLRAGCRCFATTLEAEDVQILRAKGIEAWQMDLLREESFPAPFVQAVGSVFHLCVVSNPPYLSVKGELCNSYAVRRYKHLCAQGMAEAGCVITMRVLLELLELRHTFSHYYLLVKGQTWTGKSFKPFRSIFPQAVGEHVSYYSRLFGTSGEFCIDGTLHDVNSWRITRDYFGYLFGEDVCQWFTSSYYDSPESIRLSKPIKRRCHYMETFSPDEVRRIYHEGKDDNKQKRPIKQSTSPTWQAQDLFS